jgi:hypothetical protein
MTKAEEKAAELYHKPYPEKSDDYIPNMFAMQSRKDFISGYNYKAFQHEWVSVKDRLPTEADAVDGEVEIILYLLNGSWKKLLVFYERVSEFQYYVNPIANSHWRTPLANNFPEPPKTEI